MAVKSGFSVPVTLKISEDRKEDLDLISEVYNMSLADLIRSYIDKGVEASFSSNEIERVVEESVRQRQEIAEQVRERVALRKN